MKSYPAKKGERWRPDTHLPTHVVQKNKRKRGGKKKKTKNSRSRESRPPPALTLHEMIPTAILQKPSKDDNDGGTASVAVSKPPTTETMMMIPTEILQKPKDGEGSAVAVPKKSTTTELMIPTAILQKPKDDGSVPKPPITEHPVSPGFARGFLEAHHHRKLHHSPFPGDEAEGTPVGRLAV